MAGLKLNHIYKVYDNGVKAVNDFNIDIQNNEFIVFVGPSGCGKSTTLRMIAGLETITAGELFIDDVLVNDLEPKDRDIAFVFQNYALYPHMTVFDNMAYGLKNRKLPKDEISKKVLEAAEMLDLVEYLDRKPKEMSGGQRQRVALGRALVRDPKVFLLDEPLSNLDAKLRTQMRSEITKLHKKVKTTFIYVTHDQIEAMTMGTRIVVMKNGFIQQIDTPMNLYNKPINKFVAGFIGTPQMNFYDVNISLINDQVELEFDQENSLFIPYVNVSKLNHSYFNKKVILGCRPEHVVISNTGLPCIVNIIEQLGTESILYGDIQLANNKTIPVICKIPFDSPIKPDTTIYVSFDSTHLHFFDCESEESILNEIPEKYEIEVTIENNNMYLFDQNISLPECINLENGTYKVIIPSDAIIEGQDLKLEITEQEQINGKTLIRIYNNNKYYHFVINKQALEINDLIFDIKSALSNDNSNNASILFEKLTFIKENDIVLNPINETLELDGYLTKEGKGKNIEYFFLIENNKLNPDYEKLQKVALLDGVNCHKNLYKFNVHIDNIKISNTGVNTEAETPVLWPPDVKN